MTTVPLGLKTNGIDPTEWLRTWQSVWRVAPDTLNQPILPGWTFNINSNNSSAPQTEADVVARRSYGRQLGRLSEMRWLRPLIEEGHGKQPKTPAFHEFLSMKSEIDAVKLRAAAKRAAQIGKDLRLLRESDQEGVGAGAGGAAERARRINRQGARPSLRSQTVTSNGDARVSEDLS